MLLNRKQQTFAAGAALLLVSFLVYIPAIRSGFVWNDDTFFWDNPLIHSPRGLLDFWFSTKAPDYFPLTSSMLWIEWRLFGMDHVWGYHAINVLLHALSSVLLWRLLLRLEIPGAWLAALIFAVHPVNVEAVAWVTQRKTTLPMVFALLSVLLFFKSRALPAREKTPGLHREPLYWLALLCFLLALLAKTSVVLLPVVLLIVIWWREGAIGRREITATLPFFLIAGALAMATVWFQYHVAIGGDNIRDDDFLSRLAAAGRAPWFYLFKALLPVNLVFIYPRWVIDPSNLVVYLPLVLGIVIAVALWLRRDHPWARATLAAAAIYVAMLFPVLGFFNIYYMQYSFVADHWQYAAIPAVIALVTAFAAGRAKILSKPAAAHGIGAAVVVILAALSWNLAGDYRDEETLYRETITKNPGAWLAQYNLGNILDATGRNDEAIERFRRTVDINPKFAKAYINLGTMLQEEQNLSEATLLFRKAVELEPDVAVYHEKLGIALAEIGQLEEAMTHFRMCLRIEPENALALSNLGLALAGTGRFEEAIAHYRQALEFQPDRSDTTFHLANALLQTGQLEEAITQYMEILKSDPASVTANNNLGIALRQAGRAAEAPGRFEAALQTDPAHLGALKNFAWLLATTPEDSLRDGSKAVTLATEANRLTGGKDPAVLEIVAAAFAEAGRFSDAVQTAQQALAIAAARDDAPRVDRLNRQLEQYSAGAATRDAPATKAGPPAGNSR